MASEMIEKIGGTMPKDLLTPEKNIQQIGICFQNWKIPQDEKKIISKSEWDKTFSGVYKTDYSAYKIGKWDNDTWNEYSHYVTLDDKYIYQVKKRRDSKSDRTIAGG